ncbi:MAG: MBL fold metallo-hydrolase [Verrucomicrobiae bacterium]|nr:MBL fold metallo-hydrolase [Verrucomicrobiae bacterium]
MEIKIIDLEFQGRKGGIAAFLVKGAEGAILIETGPESTREALLAGLREEGIDPADLSGVFVTHIHLDHAGAAGWFADLGVPVHVHERGARHLIDPSKLVESARRVYGDRFDVLWGGMVPAPTERVRQLADGDRVEVAGLEIVAVDTPGHAFHHHVFALGKTVFTGDAAGARLQGSPYLSVTSAPPQFHFEHTLASISRIEALEPERLFLTHFGQIEGAFDHLAAYRESVELNAEFVRQRVREGMAGEILGIAYEAFQLEQAFRLGVPAALLAEYELVNGSGMCAAGMERFWLGRFAEEEERA